MEAGVEHPPEVVEGEHLRTVVAVPLKKAGQEVPHLPLVAAAVAVGPRLLEGRQEVGEGVGLCRLVQTPQEPQALVLPPLEVHHPTRAPAGPWSSSPQGVQPRT